jgi:hypothetical protein
MIFKPHEHGLITVYNGSIMSKNPMKIYDEIAIIIDVEIGCLLKLGDPSQVKEYYNTIISRYKTINPDYGKSLIYIEFNAKIGNTEIDHYFKSELSKDEICTLINYFQNSIGTERMNQILAMNANSLHLELKKLADIGF